MSAREWTGLLLAVAMAGACDPSEHGVRPAPTPSGEGGSASSTGGASAGGEGGGHPVERTVETRNPFGEIPGNLLIDGDFEWLALPEGWDVQAGWYAFRDSGREYIRTETGGLCRSGLRCGVIEAGDVFFGRGTAANGTGMQISAWLKPPPGKACAFATVTVVPCNFNGSGTDIDAEGAEPDDLGWCHYRAEGLAESFQSICVLVETTMVGEQRALIDAVALLPDPTTTAQRRMRPLSPARQERYGRVARKVRDMTPIAPTPSRPPLLGRE
jgi:hypothetical protein